jgi:hypothetical protein
LEVGEDGVRVVGLQAGVTVNARAINSGDNLRLEDGAVLRTPQGTTLVFRAADQGYEGLLMSDTEMRLGIAKGQTVELGREPKHPGLAYPDRQGQDNIRWCSGQRAARAKAQRFSLDRALAGREQCAITLQGEQLLLRQIHTRCPTFIARGKTGPLKQAEFPPEAPAGQPQQQGPPMSIEVDDLIVAGTTVVAVRRPEQ